MEGFIIIKAQARGFMLVVCLTLFNILAKRAFYAIIGDALKSVGLFQWIL